MRTIQKNIQWVAVGFVLSMALETAMGQSAPGIRVGTLRLTPYAEVVGLYDTNINRLSDNEKDATFFDAVIGLRVDHRTRHLEVTGTGALSRREFVDDDEPNFNSGGVTLNWALRPTDKLTIELVQSFRRVEDRDEYGLDAATGGLSADTFLAADARSRREVIDVGALIQAVLTDKLDAGAGYRYSRTDYDSETLLDLETHAVQLEAGRRLTDKTAMVVTAVGSRQEIDTLDEAAEYVAARLGLRLQGTDRVNFKFGVGYQSMDRPEGVADRQGVNYDARASWAATDKTSVQLEGRNNMQMSSIHRANAVEYSVYRLGVAYRMTPAWNFIAGVVYRIDDYADQVDLGAGPIDRKDKGAGVRLRAEYRIPAKHLRLFAEGLYEDVESTIRDYEVTRVGLGASVEL